MTGHDPWSGERGGQAEVERALRALRKDLPPEGLARSISAGLARVPPPRRPAWRGLWDALQRPQVTWAYRAAMLLVLAGILVGVWRQGGRVRPLPSSEGPKDGTARAVAQPRAARAPLIPVTFTLFAPRASSVSVVSTFNDWNPQTTPMRRGKDGTWSVQVSLPQGCYEYMFLVDGARYETDPNALELRQDGMGNENAVLRL